MSNIRHLRAQARRDIHDLAKVPAFYISPYSKFPPRIVQVRLHDKERKPAGQLATSREWAHTVEVKPRVVIWRDDLPFPRAKAVFSFDQGEAYRVEAVEPADGTTVTAVCVRLTRSDAEQYPFPLPDEEVIPVDPTDPTDPGGGSGDGSALYFPVLIPSASKEVVHNLGKIPRVTILDQNEREVGAEITHDIGKNKFTVTFNPLFIGEIIVS